MLDGRFPRSLAFCYAQLRDYLDRLAAEYGDRLETHAIVARTHEQLKSQTIRPCSSTACTSDRPVHRRQQPPRATDPARLPFHRIRKGKGRHAPRDQPHHALHLFQPRRPRVATPAPHPAGLPGQTTEFWEIELEGARPEVTYDDENGNRVTLISFVPGARSGDPQPGRGADLRHGWRGGQAAGQLPLWHFTEQTALTREGPLLRALVESLPVDSEDTLAASTH
jgi:hypothetical protein